MNTRTYLTIYLLSTIATWNAHGAASSSAYGYDSPSESTYGSPASSSARGMPLVDASYPSASSSSSSIGSASPLAPAVYYEASAPGLEDPYKQALSAQRLNQLKKTGLFVSGGIAIGATSLAVAPPTHVCDGCFAARVGQRLLFGAAAGALAAGIKSLFKAHRATEQQSRLLDCQTRALSTAVSSSSSASGDEPYAQPDRQDSGKPTYPQLPADSSAPPLASSDTVASCYEGTIDHAASLSHEELEQEFKNNQQKNLALISAALKLGAPGNFVTSGVCLLSALLLNSVIPK